MFNLYKIVSLEKSYVVAKDIVEVMKVLQCNKEIKTMNNIEIIKMPYEKLNDKAIKIINDLVEAKLNKCIFFDKFNEISLKKECEPPILEEAHLAVGEYSKVYG